MSGWTSWRLLWLPEQQMISQLQLHQTTLPRSLPANNGAAVLRDAAAFLMLIALAAPTPVWAQVGSNVQVAKAAKTLGLEPENLGRDFETLAEHPREAVAMLVANLHPIARKAYYPGTKTTDSRHVIACLRALRYLTGKTFTAKTNARLTEDEKQFLDFNTEMHDVNPTHNIHFFGVWMSRDAEFVAPTDAQRKIILQWRRWQRTYGGTFHYVPAKRPLDVKDRWYWYG